eukprot:Clim_evm11s46 gene=Clim_evmTU11s46
MPGPGGAQVVGSDLLDHNSSDDDDDLGFTFKQGWSKNKEKRSSASNKRITMLSQENSLEEPLRASGTLSRFSSTQSPDGSPRPGRRSPKVAMDYLTSKIMRGTSPMGSAKDQSSILDSNEAISRSVTRLSTQTAASDGTDSVHTEGSTALVTRSRKVSYGSASGVPPMDFSPQVYGVSGAVSGQEQAASSEAQQQPQSQQDQQLSSSTPNPTPRFMTGFSQGLGSALRSLTGSNQDLTALCNGGQSSNEGRQSAAEDGGPGTTRSGTAGTANVKPILPSMNGNIWVPSIDPRTQPVPPGRKRVTQIHWRPDNDVAVCQYFGCRKEFTFLERRQHCRKCGNIFCREHCGYKLRLAPNTEHDPVNGIQSQVCEDCYNAAIYAAEQEERGARDEVRPAVVPGGAAAVAAADGSSGAGGTRSAIDGMDEGIDDNVDGYRGASPEMRMPILQRNLTHRFSRLREIKRQEARSNDAEFLALARKVALLNPELQGNERKRAEQKLVPWIPDASVEDCPICGLDFSTWTDALFLDVRRRHHCRTCGRVVCGNDLRVLGRENLFPKSGRANSSVPSTPSQASAYNSSDYTVMMLGKGKGKAQDTVALKVCTDCNNRLKACLRRRRQSTLPTVLIDVDPHMHGAALRDKVADMTPEERYMRETKALEMVNDALLVAEQDLLQNLFDWATYDRASEVALDPASRAAAEQRRAEVHASVLRSFMHYHGIAEKVQAYSAQSPTNERLRQNIYRRAVLFLQREKPRFPKDFVARHGVFQE